MGNRNANSTGTGTFPRLIHCEYCGEDYASTYRAGPFCNTAPGGRKTAPARQRSDTPQRRSGRVSGNKVPTNTRGGGYGGRRSPLSTIGILISVLLVIAAIVITIFLVRSVFSGKADDSGTAAPSNTSQTGDTGDQTAQASPAEHITLDQQDFTLAAGQSVTLQPTIAPADWAGQLIWTSSDGNVATVDQTGLVTYVGGGTCTITVSAGGTTAECTVRCQAADTGEGDTTVPDDTQAPADTPAEPSEPQTPAEPAAPASNAVAVRYLESEKTDISLKVGDVVPLNAIGGDGANYTWTMSNTAVATVSADGKVTGVSAGKTTLTVTSGDQSAEVIVRVS